jgi:hypothetical protein
LPSSDVDRLEDVSLDRLVRCTPSRKVGTVRLPRPNWRTLRRPCLNLDWEAAMSPQARRNAKLLADLWSKRAEDGKTSITIVSLAVAALAFIAKIGGGETASLVNLIVFGGAVLALFAALFFPIRQANQANRGAAFMTALATLPAEDGSASVESRAEDSSHEMATPPPAQAGQTGKVAVTATAVGLAIVLLATAASRRS